MGNFCILNAVDENEDLLYWNAELMDWVKDEKEATKFDRSILCLPLPADLGGIIEFDANNKPLHYYVPIRLKNVDNVIAFEAYDE